MRQHEAFQVYLYKLVHNEKRGSLAVILLGILYVCSLLYGLGVTFMLWLYRCGIVKQHKLPCRVISLGNITVGGTGKTPTAQCLATLIHKMGYRVVILNRGYRAKWTGNIGLVSDGQKIYMSATEAGDEAYLLAKNLPGIPVVIGKDRSITGEYACEKLKADVIIMDDGYQHWQLARDLDIVLIDTINVFGNNFLLPRGTLREPLDNLARAQVCLLTKVDQSTNDARETIRETLERYNEQVLIVESTHSPQCFIEIEAWYKGARYKNSTPLENLMGRKVMAFSAIGNPASFEQTIADIGAEVVDARRYPDHHDYTMAEMQSVLAQAIEQAADAIITTEKDAVKIPAEFIHSDRVLPLYILGIEVEFTEGYEEFMGLIEKVVKYKKTLRHPSKIYIFYTLEA